MEDVFDPRGYQTLPVFDVQAGVALGTAMLSAAPTAPPPLVLRELDRMRGAHAQLEVAWQPIRPVTQPASVKRAVDQLLDGAWAGLRQRLSAWERLIGDHVPEVARAAAIDGDLFPDGLGFLKLEYTRQWAESKRRLDHIDANALATAVDALCGAPFLAAVRQAHARYGVVLGITEAPAAKGDVPLGVREPFQAFRTALSRYVQKLIGTLDDEDAAAVAMVKAALRPIDEYRQSLTSGARPQKSGAVTDTTTPAELPV